MVVRTDGYMETWQDTCNRFPPQIWRTASRAALATPTTFSQSVDTLAANRVLHFKPSSSLYSFCVREKSRVRPSIAVLHVSTFFFTFVATSVLVESYQHGPKNGPKSTICVIPAFCRHELG
jgi:hypothetical protein